LRGDEFRMRSSLADILSLALPHASEDLISVKARGRLERVASTLPPIPCVLLECRLNGASQVDLSLGVSNSPRERQLVADFFSTANDARGWKSFSRFADWWCRNEEPENGIDSLWLEFDAKDPAEPLPAPSVFLPITKARDGQRLASPAVCRGLDLLKPGGSQLLGQWLQRLPSEAKATFIGTMLARDSDGLRFNIANFTTDAAWSWLQSFGPPRPELEGSFADVFRLGGSPVLTVDVDADIGPRFGIECQPTFESAFELLTVLERNKLCSRNIESAVRVWPGQAHPLADADVKWPLVLVLEALRQPELPLSLLLRFINHIKVVFDTSRMVEAKIYLAINHVLLPPRRSRIGMS
jgi:hypothetical protein